MKKQFHKIKIAAENFSRPTKADKNSEELLAADRHVEKYKEVLEKICRKFVQNPTSNNTNAVDQDARDKRCKKVHEYKLAQSMEESLKDLPDGLLHDVLENCAKLEKNIAMEIVNNEVNVENEVTKKLAIILENHIGRIQKQKRIVTKIMQDNESAKHKYQAAVRVNDNTGKINQLREEQEECEAKLEKERDIWAAEMFELISEEDVMANHVINYIKYQQLYYKSALEEIEDVMNCINGLIKGNNRKVFKVPLEEHLNTTERTISYVIELCVCCLLEKGLFEEGLLRVGCAGSKLRRFRSAMDANLVTTPYPNEYQDVHVIACALKSYLRDLPEPLLTFNLYDQFIAASQRPTEEQRKTAILNTINLLPKPNYLNLRYLTKFLELLSQKNKTNKMTPQNIAIVMSPNLLWSPETGDGDYVSKVNSTASVNTIVEALVSDWTYFFGDDFAISDFYVTMSRDDLFPHNGGFPVDRDFSTDNIMTKSLNIVSAANNQNHHHHPNQSVGNSSINSYQTHSRGSSHDTSLILIENEITSGSTDSLAKRSQSNSSLSDSSPPPQSSPKLPVRKKKVAPTPPDNRTQRAAEHYSNTNSGSQQSSSESMQAMKERFLNSCSTPADDSKFSSNRFIRNETKAQQTNTVFKPPSTPASMKQCSSSTENLSATKPDKPPRPALPAIDSQTLQRNAFKSKGSERHSRPIALPRNILNVARSTENLSTVSPVKTPTGLNLNDDSEIVHLRDRSNENNRNDKPAIPERPTSLMKSNLRAVFDKFDSHQTILPDSPGIKKTQSFRMSSTTPVANAVGSITGRSLTTLERTHIYNVDKKQVEIIDVDQQSNGNGSGTNSESSSNGKNSSSSDKENDKEKDGDQSEKSNESNGETESNNGTSDGTHLLSTSTGNTMSSSTTNTGNNEFAVPQSPRCFEPKLIKRPQIPAPPPPNVTIDQPNQASGEQIQHRKSDTLTADFTKL
ncbi:rho GTPase-activating protein 92B-like [Sitodiplosis mosellana]|uniref:rho GTPase-activating protein 92B-like n=1 Tax=Sitodiplosis mosellana TaxID=263140 RepID=UPI002444E1F6|nr:rho GTPase-activating protein 92B-like [Sitodiplosis mosellana]XP_055319808.1 rho GTPase-activating protein 92B-like [Sitodiplosis mosellana]